MHLGQSCSFLIHLGGNCAVSCAVTGALYLSVPPSECRPIHRPCQHGVPARRSIRECLTIIDLSKPTTAATRFRSC
jgi:hypothetical protein